jgi:hypothetical protein
VLAKARLPWGHLRYQLIAMATYLPWGYLRFRLRLRLLGSDRRSGAGGVCLKSRKQ